MTVTARPPRPPAGAVAPAGPRLAARARAERSGRRRVWRTRVLRSLLVLLPVAALAWVVLASPWLAVDRVQVVGVARLSGEQVAQAAAVGEGTPLARVDVAGAADRVRALAPVLDARVRRVWPATLRIEVTERTAVAAAPAGADGRDGVRLLDAEGVGFATEPRVPDGLPRLEVPSPGPDDPATRAALQVLRDLPPQIAAQVAVLRASTATDVAFQLADGRTVVWGAPEDAATKAAAVTALLRMPGQEYDVSAPGVAVRR